MMGFVAKAYSFDQPFLEPDADGLAGEFGDRGGVARVGHAVR